MVIETTVNFRVIDPFRLIDKINSVVLGIYDLGIGNWEARWSIAVSYWEAIHRKDLFCRLGSLILQDVQGNGFLSVDSNKVVGEVVVESGHRIRDRKEYETLTLILNRPLFLRNGKGSVPESKVEICADLPDSGCSDFHYKRQDCVKRKHWFGYSKSDLSGILLNDWFLKEGILRPEQ